MTSATSRRDFLAATGAAAVLPSLLPACSRSSSPSPGESAPLDIDWGFPPDAVRVGLNESPLGPSPRAAEAMTRAITQANRYLLSGDLHQRLAHLHGVAPEWILLACGSTELLRNIPHAYCGAGDEIIAARQSYRELPIEARRIGLRSRLIPVTAAHEPDLEAMAGAITDRTRVLCITNPNNPTGTLLGRDAIAALVAAVPASVQLVVDQAYIGFAAEADVTGLVERHPNLIVLQTFSKLYGLAGMRIGYAIAHPELLRPLRRLALRYNINTVGFAGALAALDDDDYVARYRALTREGASFFARELDTMKLEFVPGVTPFVIVKVGKGREVTRALAERGVFVRAGRDWDMSEWIRISYGTLEQNRAVVAALARVMAG